MNNLAVSRESYQSYLMYCDFTLSILFICHGKSFQSYMSIHLYLYYKLIYQSASDIFILE